MLVTTWKTPSGWVVVRDALTIGPTRGPDTVTPHTRPPADDDAEHVFVRTAECLDGQVEMELVCEPVFDYGDDAGHLDARRRDRPHAPTPQGRSHDAAAHRHGARRRRPAGSRAVALLRAGERVFCALSWAEGLAAPADVDDAPGRIDATVAFWRAWLNGARIPDHRWRRADPTLGTGDQGSHVHAHGRHRRRAHDVVAGDAWRRAQLGLPLHAGCATPRSRCRRCTGSTSTGRPTSSCSSSPTSRSTTTARCRSCTASTVGATSPSRR